MQAFVTIVAGGKGGDGNDRQVPARCFASADATAGLQAVHARHLAIHQYYIGRVFSRQFYCFLTVAGCPHDRTHQFECFGEHVTVDCVVFGEQDDQTVKPACNCRVKVAIERDFGRISQRQVECQGEATATTFTAAQTDVSAHHFG